jgi:hypothetical protein
MKTLTLIACLSLTACASVPPDIARAKQQVDAGMTYVEYKSTEVKSMGCVIMRPTHKKPEHLTPQEGNCVDFAYAYKDALGRGMVMNERLPDGTGHAYMVVDGWRLDNRYAMPVPAYHRGCK